MKRIVLIHTVKSVLDSFEKQLRSVIGDKVVINNILDDFLVTDFNDTGHFSPENRKRLENDVENAMLAHADIIVATCSTITPTITALRPFVSVPLIAIDDEMCRQAVRFGDTIAVLATAQSTVEPTVSKITYEAAQAGVDIEIETAVCPEAIAALRANQKERHDTLVLQMAEKITGKDAIVLAQASMAHLEGQVAQLCGSKTLSSVSLCIDQIAKTLKELP